MKKRKPTEKERKELEEIEKIVSKSKLTKKDAKEISRLVNDSVAKKLRIKQKD